MLIANFNSGATSIYVKGLWQYDKGQILRIQGLDLPEMVEIHFSLKETGGIAERKIGITRNGVTDVEIPNEMLVNNDKRIDYDLYAFIYVTDALSGETQYSIVMEVISRPKPQDYVPPVDPDIFSETLNIVRAEAKEAKRWAVGEPTIPGSDIDNAKYYSQQAKGDADKVTEMLNGTSGLKQEVSSLKQTLDEHIQKFPNGGGSGGPIVETDPTVPQWAKEPTKPTYTAQEVGALPNSTHIPTQLAEMTEDATHRVVSDAEKQAWNSKSDFSGSYNDLTNKPTIPSKLSEMAGDVNNRTVTDAEKQTWNAKAEKSDIPDVANFATKAELGNKADKTEIANLATKAELQDKANQSELNLVKENLNGFIPKNQGVVNQGKVLEVGADGNVVPKDKQQIPTKLPNPQKLTFQGAVTAEYDGSGAVTVTIPSGASGGSAEVERIEKLASDTAVELTENKLYIFPEMASLTYTLKAPTKNNVANEYHFVFKSGASATQLVHAMGVNVGTFKVEPNKIYEISIMENLLTSQSWAVV